MALSTIGQTALAYAAAGVHVLPLCWPTRDAKGCGSPYHGLQRSTGARCLSAGKMPIASWSLGNATTDPGRIRDWWERWPDANVGADLARSGLIVLDIDSPAALAEAKQRSGPAGLPFIVVARSGRDRGGWHVYFRRPADCPAESALHQGADGLLDLLGDGGIVLPPSQHYMGTRYRWMRGDLATDYGQLPEPPGWIVDTIRTQPPGRFERAVIEWERENGSAVIGPNAAVAQRLMARHLAWRDAQ